MGQLAPPPAASMRRLGFPLVSGSNDGTLRLWDIKTSKELKQFPGIADQIRSVDFSADGIRRQQHHRDDKEVLHDRHAHRSPAMR